MNKKENVDPEKHHSPLRRSDRPVPRPDPVRAGAEGGPRDGTRGNDTVATCADLDPDGAGGGGRGFRRGLGTEPGSDAEAVRDLLRVLGPLTGPPAGPPSPRGPPTATRRPRQLQGRRLPPPPARLRRGPVEALALPVNTAPRLARS